MTLIKLEGGEGWLAYAPNESELEVPEERASVEVKSESERLRAVLFVWYKQELDANNYVGLFENFKKEKMEKIIEMVKSKLN